MLRPILLKTLKGMLSMIDVVMAVIVFVADIAGRHLQGKEQ
jgi:hypothetical protein